MLKSTGVRQRDIIYFKYFSLLSKEAPCSNNFHWFNSLTVNFVVQNAKEFCFGKCEQVCNKIYILWFLYELKYLKYLHECVIVFIFLVLCTYIFCSLQAAGNNKGRTRVSVTKAFMVKLYSKIYTFYFREWIIFL